MDNWADFTLLIGVISPHSWQVFPPPPGTWGIFFPHHIHPENERLEPENDTQTEKKNHPIFLGFVFGGCRDETSKNYLKPPPRESLVFAEDCPWS